MVWLQPISLFQLSWWGQEGALDADAREYCLQVYCRAGAWCGDLVVECTQYVFSLLCHARSLTFLILEFSFILDISSYHSYFQWHVSPLDSTGGKDHPAMDHQALAPLSAELDAEEVRAIRKALETGGPALWMGRWGRCVSSLIIRK